MNKKKILISGIILTAICGGLVVFLKIAQKVFEDVPTSEEEAVTLTTQLLSYASDYPIGVMPRDKIPISFDQVQESCWDLLQKNLREDGKPYTVTAYVKDYFPVHTSTAQIVFANGQRISLYYYEGGYFYCLVANH